jgi:CII-binding regulator of phage lambda lysogenization HflD
MRSAILYGLLSILSSPIKAEEVSEEEQPSARVASIVTCNQGERAQLADISACLGAIKNSIGFPGPGQPNLNSKTEIIESLVEVIVDEIGSGGGNSVHIKIDIIESKIDLLQEELSIVDASLCTKLNRIESEIINNSSVVEDIDSKIELLCSKVEIVDSQNDVIESKIDDINIDISVSDAELCTKLLRIESEIINNSSVVEDIDSKIELLCSKVEIVDSQNDVIESKIDDINIDISISDAELCTKLIRIESKIDSNTSTNDTIQSEVEVIDSNLDVVCTKILTVDSKIDDINIDISQSDAELCTKLIRIESKVDSVDSEVEIIDSNLDVVCTKVLRVESKVDVNTTVINNINSKVDVINSKVDVIDIDLSLTDDSLCSKLIVIDSKVDVIDSITDDLHDTACIGRYIIRNSDLPFLIDAARGPGLYSIGEPLTWAGPGAAITVTTDGVDIDFHCLNLDVVGSNATANFGILYGSNVGQCSIRNGRMSSLTIDPNTLLPFTQPTILIFKPVSAADDALYLIDNMLFASDSQVSVPNNQLISFTGVIDVAIQNCRFFQGSQGAIFLGCSRVSIDNCLFERVFNEAAAMSSGQSCSITNSTFKICGQDIQLISQNDTIISNCTHQLSGRMTGQNSVSATSCNTLIIKDCCNSFAGARGAAGGVSAYVLTSCINAMILRNAVDTPTANGILLTTCASCKVIDNSVEAVGGAFSGIADSPSPGINLVLGNCSAFSTTNYFGVDPTLIAAGTGPISTANNRWINVSF